MKQVSFGKQGIDKMVRGMDTVADAVGGTIGPKGRNVFLDGQVTPSIINDGYRIANDITLEDREENAGAYLIRNISSQQNDDCGDGTTTASVLVQAIIHEAMKRPENGMELKHSLKTAGEKALHLLKGKATAIALPDIGKIALISAEDAQLANLVTEIFQKLGAKATITIENSKTFATDYEIVDGYEAMAGFVSPEFITDKATGKALYEEALVLVSEKKIANLMDVKTIFDKIGAAQKNNDSPYHALSALPVLVVCDDISDDMVGVFIRSRMLGIFPGAIIKAHGITLKDIEGITGARAVSDANGLRFDQLEITDLGRVKKVIADAHKTIFLGEKSNMERYATTLEQEAEHEPNQYIAKNLKDRSARARSGVAVLRIGSPTDFERVYLKEKADDTVKACKAALEEGIVEGGGMTLYRLSNELESKTPGETILKNALKVPLKRIIENAGQDYTDIVKNLPKGKGYNAKTNEYENLMDSGVIDPSKVERCALENAISAASQFITIFAIVTDAPHEKD